MSGDKPLSESERADLERYRQALEHIAAGCISPAIGFAQRVLDGATAREAHRAESEEARRRWEGKR